MQPGEQLGKGPGVPSARPHAAPCTRGLIQGRVWLCSGFYFWIFFSPQGPCLYLQPLGGRRAGGSPDSNRLRVNVRDPWGRSSLGDCWAVREGLRKLACSQVVGGHSRGTTLWRKFGRFYFCSDGQALYSSQSTPGTPAYGKSTGAQSSKCKGSLQQKANQSKGPPLGNCVNNSGASAQ